MNPTGHPLQPRPANAEALNAAREEVNLASLLLLIFGGVGVLWIFVNLLGASASLAQLEQVMNLVDYPEELRGPTRFLAGPAAMVLQLVGIAILGLMTFGAWQMRNLKSYGLAMTACVLGMLPCSGCCCITLPVGIWALTILMKPEVKSAFS